MHMVLYCEEPDSIILKGVWRSAGDGALVNVSAVVILRWAMPDQGLSCYDMRRLVKVLPPPKFKGLSNIVIIGVPPSNDRGSSGGRTHIATRHPSKDMTAQCYWRT